MESTQVNKKISLSFHAEREFDPYDSDPLSTETARLMEVLREAGYDNIGITQADVVHHGEPLPEGSTEP